MPPHYHGSRQELLALDVFVKLNRACSSLQSRLLARDTLEDLTASQFAVMEALYHLGPLSQTDISNKVLRSGGNITLVIDNLEKYQWVERHRNKDDRRVITVVLTDAGRDKIARIFPNHLAAIVDEFSVLTFDEQEILAHLCRKLGVKG